MTSCYPLITDDVMTTNYECPDKKSWVFDHSSEFNTGVNICSAFNPDCWARMKLGEMNGFILYGYGTKSSGTYGCQLNEDSTQWFYLDPSFVGEKVELCHIAGLKDDVTLTIWTGGVANTGIGVSHIESTTKPFDGCEADGKTFCSTALRAVNKEATSGIKEKSSSDSSGDNAIGNIISAIQEGPTRIAQSTSTQPVETSQATTFDSIGSTTFGSLSPKSTSSGNSSNSAAVDMGTMAYFLIAGGTLLVLAAILVTFICCKPRAKKQGYTRVRVRLDDSSGKDEYA